MLFGQIVSEARASKKLSLRDLAALVGASAATLSKIEHLEHIPRDKLIEKLIHVLDLHADKVWTQVGRQKAAPYRGDLMADGLEPMLTPVPIVGKVTAGALIEAPDYEDGGYPSGSGFDTEMVPVRNDETGLYGLTVEGDSMEPVFSRGDYVFAAPNKEPKSNGFAVVRLINGEVLLKRVLIQKDIYILQSANPAYATITVHQSEILFIHPITIHRLS